MSSYHLHQQTRGDLDDEDGGQRGEKICADPIKMLAYCTVRQYLHHNKRLLELSGESGCLLPSPVSDCNPMPVFLLLLYVLIAAGSMMPIKVRLIGCRCYSIRFGRSGGLMAPPSHFTLLKP